MTAAVRRNSNGVGQQGLLSEMRPVAGYLRSATRLEGDLLRKQLQAVVRYARYRDMQLIRIYCDECGSGLRNGGQSGLRQMLRDIERATGDFDAVLLLDPSRWGRFGAPGRVPPLEYRCRQAGIEVHYCAVVSEFDRSSYAGTVRRLKRVMADEDGREPSSRLRPSTERRPG